MVRVNLLLLALLIACGVSLVTSRHQARKLFVDLERTRADARNFEIEYGQLQLEQSTWAKHALVESIAVRQLGMRAPDPRRLGVGAVAMG